MSDKTGVKYDAEKPEMSLINPEFLVELGKVLTAGAKKYSPDNYKRVDRLMDRAYSACLRHLCAYRKGEILDPETGISHIIHAAANLMFMYWRETNEEGTDDTGNS